MSFTAAAPILAQASLPVHTGRPLRFGERLAVAVYRWLPSEKRINCDEFLKLKCHGLQGLRTGIARKTHQFGQFGAFSDGLKIG